MLKAVLPKRYHSAIRLGAEGYFPKAKLTNMFVKQPKGELVDATVAAGGQTWHDCFKAPCVDFDEVQLVYKNDRAASFDIGASPLVGVIDDISGGYIEPNGGNTIGTGWTQAEFGGATGSFTVPARIADRRPTFKISDRIAVESVAPTDGSGEFPYLLVRTYIAAAEQISQWYHGESWDANPTDKASCSFWQTRKRTGDHCTTASGMTNANSAGNPDGDSPLAAVIFYSKSETAARVVIVGDSIVMGQGAEINGYYYYGFPLRVQDLYDSNNVTLQNARLNIINGGWGGSTTDQSELQLNELIDNFDPAMVIDSVHSPNDNGGTFNSTVAAAQLVNAGDKKALADANGSKYATIFIAPNDNLATGADNARKQLITDTAALYDTLDLTSAVGDGATPERFIPGANRDNLHPHSRGYRKLRDKFNELFSVLVGRSDLSELHKYEKQYRIERYETGVGLTLNGSDIESWQGAWAGSLRDQLTPAYQPALGSNGEAVFDGASYTSLDGDSVALSLLKNKTGCIRFIVFESDAAATKWLDWISINGSASNYRDALRTLDISSSGYLQNLYRRLDGDTGLAQTSATAFTNNAITLGISRLDFTANEKSVDVMPDTIIATAAGSTGNFSDTDSADVAFGTSSNRFDGGAFSGSVWDVGYYIPGVDIDLVVEELRREHELYTLSI